MNKQTQQKLLAIVSRNYEEIADDYNITRKRSLQPLWDELIKLAGEVKEGAQVLDVGCGNGRLIEAFGNKKIKYVGVDANSKLLEHARMNYDLRFINDEFLIGDALELDGIERLKSKRFDYIFSVAMLHHLPGRDLQVKALEQMKNKLKNEGKLIITVWKMWGQDKFKWPLMKEAIKSFLGLNGMDIGDILFDWNGGKAGSQRYYHAFTKRELARIANKAGMRVEKLYKDKYNYYLILCKS